ncbi:MAG: hypothetical protein HQ528_07670 [Candidatus Marinimicrobia bacterium]|nr:hypothetical protein [Candidatus Neomarinimicrobiota bacterium]
MDTKNHPVWTIYDEYRTARLNVKYYSALLYKAENKITWINRFLLVTAPGSIVAGLWFWDFTIGQITWKIFGVIAAFLVTIQPTFNFTSKIKKYECKRYGYQELHNELDLIVIQIATNKKYTENLKNEFHQIMSNKSGLKGYDDGRNENKRIKKRCTSEVKRELPTRSFFIPKELTND